MSANTRNLSLFKVFMSEDVIEPLNKVVMSGFITQGPQVDQFEKKLQEYFNNPYCVTLSSATSGLTLALRLLKEADAANDWPGFDVENDVVLSPALTCFATNAAILANDAKIRWLDVDTQTANICLKDLESKLNAETKVVYVVHWGGYPTDLNRLKQLQETHKQKYGYKFAIVEDCAHSFGATYEGLKLGNHGNICVFSFQAIKHLTTGDGGLIILPNQTLYERSKLLRWFGIDRDQRNFQKKDLRLEADIKEYGYKFHMNDLNATLGLYNLPHMDDLLAKNRANAKYLTNNLSQVPDLRLFENESNRESAYWLYSIAVQRKDAFIQKMKSHGIFTSQVHNRNDKHTCVQSFTCELPQIDAFEKELVCIPVGWWLSKEDLDYMIEHIKAGW